MKRNKKPITRKQNVKLRYTFILFAVLALNSTSLFSQSKVLGLRNNGQNVTTAKVTVSPPGKGGSKSQINVNDILLTGTTLFIPSGIKIILQSPGGKQFLSSTQGKAMEYMLKTTAKSENHIVKGTGAQVKNEVTKRVGYDYRATNRGTTGSADGTIFTFTDMSEGDLEKATITTQEGRINIIDKVPVTIGGVRVANNKRGDSLTKGVSKQQTPDSALFTSSTIPVNYDDYEDAISKISNEINSIDDLEDKADNLLCIGDIYMEDKRPKDAIEPFYQAMSIFIEYYGDDDLYTIEATLSLAEAYNDSGKKTNATNLLNKIEEILLELEDMNDEDLEFIKSDEEVGEASDIICKELSEIYGLLGWVYEIWGDEQKSKAYYTDMINPCKNK